MTTDPTPPALLRDQMLHAIDFAYTTGVLGYGTPEELLAAYDASRTPPPADRAALRKLLITALDNAHHTHPCPALGDQTWSGCVHYDEAGRMLGVGVCHSERRADAVLAVLPEPADRATEVEQLRIKNERMRHELEVMYSGAFDSTEPADRADLDSLGREADRLRKAWGEMRDRAERIEAEVERLRADRAAVLREAADAVAAHPGPIPYRPQLDEDGGFWWDTRDRDAIVALLRRMADETQPEPATACAHCGGDHSWDDCKAYTALVAADETQPAQAPAAEPEETDEQRADREETERDHARGDHTYCGITCEIEMPTEHLRNFVIAKGYPGTKGALAELERRAHAEAAADLPARIDRMRPEFTEHASIAAIDAQLDRARRQERRWHLRVEWLIGLRQARTEQPAAGAQQGGVGISPPPA